MLENLTGGDWKDVELTLVSGNPVALKQALYSAVFVDRPEIPVAASARIVPRKDDAEEQERELSFAQAMPAAKSTARSFHAAPAAPAAPVWRRDGRRPLLDGGPVRSLALPLIKPMPRKPRRRCSTASLRRSRSPPAQP